MMPSMLGVALDHGLGGVLDLLEGGMRRDRRNIGVGPDVQQGRPVSGQVSATFAIPLPTLASSEELDPKPASFSCTDEVSERARCSCRVPEQYHHIALS
jgi:hypothetical protein